jgi:regulator of protease activity HflC (stomatin/prohibitin superfamily)
MDRVRTVPRLLGLGERSISERPPIHPGSPSVRRAPWAPASPRFPGQSRLAPAVQWRLGGGLEPMQLSEERKVYVNGNGLSHAGGAHDASARVILEQRPRSYDGWRAGKPEEDPEKTKRWGRISARPSEYLIHMRRGKVLPQSSGQGASCFKFPGDSVAVVPTTVQRLQFVADQVTNEKAGIEVTGLAVYRIADPLIAFRMLNFSFPERAQEKLEEMLCEMFVGAVRRLVANLTIEQCLARRKQEISEELMREIAPVVSGSGRIEDDTDKGWGVILDTIEIQNVRVLSPAVFSNMQARYRKEQERQAREAALATERAIQLEEAEAGRAIELSKLSAEAEVRKRRQESEERARLDEISATSRVNEAKLADDRAAQQARVQAERDVLLAKLHAELELKQRRRTAEEEARLAELAAETRMAEARLIHERQMATQQMEAQIERVRLEAEAQAARHAARMAAAAQEAEQLRVQAAIIEARRSLAEADLAIAELESRKSRFAQELELDRARALRLIENTVSQEIIQLTLAQQLPQLAAAFQQRMGEVHVTAVDGANPFGFIASAIESVLGLARSAGLSLPTKQQSRAAGPESEA